jgi:uncharacterized membrane protein
MSRRTWLRELPHLAAIGAMFIYAIVRWPNAPDRFPAHWGFSGDIDRYGGKFEGLLLVPIIAVGVYLLLLAIPRIDPSRENYRRFATAYSMIRLVILAVLGFVYVVIQVSAAGRDVDVNLAIGLAMGGMIFVLGSVMGRIKPNYMVGVRTPWTLASQASWAKTHRITGWLFMASGAATIIVSLIWTTAGVIVLLASVLTATVVAVAYSYWAYSVDVERVPVMGAPRSAGEGKGRP